MAQRVVFTDPSTGRFVSAADAADLEQAIRTVFSGGEVIERQILSFGELFEDLTQGAEANWDSRPSQWGEAWDSEDGQLNFSALQDAAFPADATSYRVVYNVADNPDYPRGYATSETLSEAEWPPRMDLLEGVPVTGVARILFDRRQYES